MLPAPRVRPNLSLIYLGVDPVGLDSNSEPDFDPLIFRSDCMIFFFFFFRLRARLFHVIKIYRIIDFDP